MLRPLDEKTLDQAARDYAGFFLQRDVQSIGGAFISGPGRVMQDFFNFTFKDEFEYLHQAIRDELGSTARLRFDDMAKERFTERDEKVLETLLADKLAVDLNGDHRPGKIGTVQLGNRFVGMQTIVVESPASIRFRKWMKSQGRSPGERQTIIRIVPKYWPVYAGEVDERDVGSGVADALPEEADAWPVDIVQATNPKMSNECAVDACNGIVDKLDEGAGAAVIQCRTGAQPADPDTATTGTLLGTLTCSDPAFGNAVDDTGKATATASAITDDSSADATGTLGYNRASATTTPPTPIDDHIDGEAGTSGSDFNWNTLAFVSGAVISMTSWTVSVNE